MFFYLKGSKEMFNDLILILTTTVANFSIAFLTTQQADRIYEYVSNFKKLP